jgi:hypothetical protein
MAPHINQMVRISPFSNLGPIPHRPRITTLRGEARHFYYTGALQTSRIIQEMSAHIFGHSDADIASIQQAVKEYIEISVADHLSSRGETNASVAISKGSYVKIRITKAVNPGSFMPPWHTDGNFLPTKDVNSIYSTTLLGNPTRILHDGSVVASEIGKGSKARYLDPAKQAILDTHPVEFIALGDVIRFTYGQPDSCLHSGGKNDKERIFILAAFGTAEEIRVWSSRVGQTYGNR